MNFKTDISFAKEMDRKDELSRFRESFLFPKQENGDDCIYLCGNSLGLQPKQTREYIDQELSDWSTLGVEGHFQAMNPWMRYHESLAETSAEIVGAKPHECVIMNTLTANLHFMMVSFYRPFKKRTKILIEADAFPSDRFAVASQIEFHGGNPEEDIVLWRPKKGKHTPDLEDLEQILKEQGDEIALIMIGAINYYTGQFFDLKKITEMGHKHGCVVGFDCAHGAGNVSLNLHDSGADFAVWCTYKYMNSGPGSLGGCFIHERHADNPDLPRFTGWWGHNIDTRFKMRDDFDPMYGADGWQLSNPPILSMAAIRSSMDLFKKASFEKLRAKSITITNYLEYLLQNIEGDRIQIITPSDPEKRGCQLSLAVKDADKGLFEEITRKGVIADWREPDVIRVAPAPLYNSFLDCWKFVDILKSSM